MVQDEVCAESVFECVCVRERERERDEKVSACARKWGERGERT